jgi:hypothetical protein
MGSTVIKKVAWKVIELEDLEIDPEVKCFFATLELELAWPSLFCGRKVSEMTGAFLSFHNIGQRDLKSSGHKCQSNRRHEPPGS